MKEGKPSLLNKIARFFEKQKKSVSSEFLESEIPAPYLHGLMAARETILLFWILYIAFPSLFFPIPLMIFLGGWILWKMLFSAYAGWEKLQRLHRIIEKEEWEISHHRPQERKELLHIYQAKGFSGKLLEEVVDVLMANDNRLLQVMIEEEMGIVLESYDHPLVLGAGAFLGVFFSSLLMLLSLFFFPPYGIFILGLILVGLLAAGGAHFAKNKKIPAVLWHEGISLLIISVTFFLKTWIL
jgi:vacuolar iron transporter family protein